MACHKRIKFCSTSEAFSARQRDLFDETQETGLNAMQADLEQLASLPRAKNKPSRRKPLPAALPRIEHRHEPELCFCGACGQALMRIGEDITEQLDVEPARFFVQWYIRPKYACRQCETITAAAIFPYIIDGSLATPSLHAWVVIQKYQDHLPLYHIEQSSARHGVAISRSTFGRMHRPDRRSAPTISRALF